METTLKVCTDCHIQKPVTEFYMQGQEPGRRRGNCKPCVRRYQKIQDQMRDPWERRDGHYRRQFNLTVADYKAKLESQRGCCAICQVHHSKLKYVLCVDHDHATGRVRGLLCVRCNSILGHAKDNPSVLEAGIAYLRHYTAATA